jgi:lysophospholipase L1-like esterase
LNPPRPQSRRYRVVAPAVLLVALLALAQPAHAADAPAFELKDGDRVALVGNTFFEREQTYSYLETLLQTRFPDRNVAIRNLGWSGDTVFGTARAYFEGPDAGFERLTRHVAEVKPSVLFVCYGMGESFDGPGGLEGFVKGYNRLLDMLRQQSAEGARVVLISPIRHEALGEPYPDPREHNANLKQYTEAIAAIAKERGARFINLFDKLIPESSPRETTGFRYTDNGIHLNPLGYYKAALEIERQLGYGPRGWTVTADAAKAKVSADGAKAALAELSPGKFEVEVVPAFAPAPAVGVTGDPFVARTLKAVGLPAGNYALKAGDKTLAKGSADGWAGGVEISHSDDPATRPVEQLRQLLVAKNVQYFNKYRPANETYIFLFRKREQGNNAVEIPQFDGPIAELEAKVAQLRKPEKVTYVLVKE